MKTEHSNDYNEQKKKPSNLYMREAPLDTMIVEKRANKYKETKSSIMNRISTTTSYPNEKNKKKEL